jgi:hypothetical protein
MAAGLTANWEQHRVGHRPEAARELKRLESPFFAYPHGLAAHPNGRVILLRRGGEGLCSLDVATLSVTEKLSTGMEGSHMVVLSFR